MSFRNFLVLLLIFAGCLSCKKGGSETLDSYVVLVSFDGFRWDYTDIYETPSFDNLEKQGVKAERMIPSFPTKTFPNHFSIATGLYPDHHGIINNTFYAPDLNGIYRMGDSEMVTNKDAYFGEPIWVTAELQGIKSASYFWVGSEAPIKDTYPTYRKAYDGSVPYLDRVDQVIAWLKLPVEKRPGLILLYFDEPDGKAHQFGPVSGPTGSTVYYLDSVLAYLRDELADLEYSDRINLIVLSDHGMGPISPDRYVNLYDHLEQEWLEMMLGGNPVYLIDAIEGYEAQITSTLNGIEGVSAWQEKDIPEHLNYGTNPRFPDILVVADSSWSIGTRSDAEGYSGGAHGYDNNNSDMHAIFYAEGPAFKKDYTSPPFENIEVYGIIAHILGLEPAQNDGRLSNVMGMFSK